MSHLLNIKIVSQQQQTLMLNVFKIYKKSSIKEHRRLCCQTCVKHLPSHRSQGSETTTKLTLPWKRNAAAVDQSLISDLFNWTTLLVITKIALERCAQEQLNVTTHLSGTNNADGDAAVHTVCSVPEAIVQRDYSSFAFLPYISSHKSKTVFYARRTDSCRAQ